MQKQKELAFYNISRHIVKSNCGSSFPGAGPGERACFVPTQFRYCDTMIKIKICIENLFISPRFTKPQLPHPLGYK